MFIPKPKYIQILSSHMNSLIYNCFLFHSFHFLPTTTTRHLLKYHVLYITHLSKNYLFFFQHNQGDITQLLLIKWLLNGEELDERLPLPHTKTRNKINFYAIFYPTQQQHNNNKNDIYAIKIDL
jgi:hypothetical protein